MHFRQGQEQVSFRWIEASYIHPFINHHTKHYTARGDNPQQGPGRQWVGIRVLKEFQFNSPR